MVRKILIIVLLSYCWVNGMRGQQTVLYPGLTGKVLRDSLVVNYKPVNVLSYDTARDTLYGVIDIHKDYVRCLYTGDSIPITPDSSVAPRTQASNMGYSTEHGYPQSMGAATGNPRSNLHHLLPVRQDVNSSRNNLPYMDIPDSLVTRWWRLNYSQTTVPDSLKEEYSKHGSNGFEVRDAAKGNAARAVFYFYTIYQSEAESTNPDFFNIQLKYLRRWHFDDAPDSLEYVRNGRVALVQDDKINPFIIDTTLVKRAYGIDPPKDFIIDIIDSIHVKLKWNKNDKGDNVLIVRNQSGVIEDPSDGVPYQDGQSGLNGFIRVTHEDSLTDILPQMGAYFYKIYSITDTNTFSVGLIRFSATGFSDALHYWNFNNNPPESGQQWGNTILSVSGNGLLSHSFADVQSFQGTLLNSQLDDVGGGSFCPRGMVNNDSSIVLTVPTTGYKDIEFSYATRGTSTGYYTQSIYYSVDGVNYDSLVSFNASNYDWLVRAVDFSSLGFVNNNAQFKIKLIVRGATSTLGNNRFDNFKVTGKDLNAGVEALNYQEMWLEFFPNPFSGKVNIRYTNRVKEAMTAELYTMTGRKVMCFRLPAGEAGTTEVIDLEHLPRGSYIIRVISGQKVLCRKLIVR